MSTMVVVTLYAVHVSLTHSLTHWSVFSGTVEDNICLQFSPDCMASKFCDGDLEVNYYSLVCGVCVCGRRGGGRMV